MRIQKAKKQRKDTEQLIKEAKISLRTKKELHQRETNIMDS